MNKKVFIPLAIFGGALALAAVPSVNGVRLSRIAYAQAQPDAAAVTLLNNFLKALQNGDEAARLKAALPLLHRSLLSEDGNGLEASVRFQFKKASQNAGNYASPVNVTNVKAKGAITLGEGTDNPEKGRIEQYFIAKKGSGPAAPVTIFFPENGAPKIYYMGSL